MSTFAVRSLAVHSSYRCRHAGACCTANWPIPIEADRLIVLNAALASGQVRSACGDAHAAIERPPDAPADTPAMLGRQDGRCAFFDGPPAARGGRCRVQAALGHDAIPLACRQFPRVSVYDPRGTSVTLSHDCPTAAALLDAASPDETTIVTNAPAFPDRGEYVGLDARHSLPPLLRPDLLMDWESWWECERLAVRLLASADDSATGAAMARLRMAVAEVERWSPVDGLLIDRVRDAFARAAAAAPRMAAAPAAQLIEVVFASIPEEIRPARFAATPPPTDRAVRRFLAAHAFANWTIHLGTGLRGWLGSIEAAAALIDAGAGVRQTDRLLRHLVDPRDLADALPRV